MSNNMLMRLRRPTSDIPPDWFNEFWNSWEDADKYDNCLDHGRGYKNVAVFAPYGADGQELCGFLLECEKQGFEVDLVGKTYYYPGSSFTICICRKQDEEEMWEFVQGIETNIEVPVDGRPLRSKRKKVLV